jgi:hypothetical protein
LTFGWPVNSEKIEGRSVSSSATSGLFSVETGRSAIACEHGETKNPRQGQSHSGFSPFLKWASWLLRKLPWHLLKLVFELFRFGLL